MKVEANIHIGNRKFIKMKTVTVENFGPGVLFEFESPMFEEDMYVELIRVFVDDICIHVKFVNNKTMKGYSIRYSPTFQRKNLKTKRLR